MDDFLGAQPGHLAAQFGEIFQMSDHAGQRAVGQGDKGVRLIAGVTVDVLLGHQIPQQSHSVKGGVERGDGGVIAVLPPERGHRHAQAG